MKEKPVEKCTHLEHVSIHPSIRIGGAAVGRCDRDVLPGMTVCYLHADREALSIHIKRMAKRLEQLDGPEWWKK